MYEKYYNLTKKPFELVPDPEFLYLSKKHEEALVHMIYGVQEKKGFIVVTGDIGAGKTTLSRTLINKFSKKNNTALILNTSLSGHELLKAIVEDFGIKLSGGESKKDLVDKLNMFLIEEVKKGKNSILLIDEAQNLPNELLEEIRMLSNLETEKEKLIQIIFIAQPEFLKTLAQPELKQLSQRIAVKYRLTGLEKEDVKKYIYHRLKVAGSPEPERLFPEAAAESIAEFSEGIPRLINIICDRALLTGFNRGLAGLTEDIIEEAADDFIEFEEELDEEEEDIDGDEEDFTGKTERSEKKAGILNISVMFLLAMIIIITAINFISIKRIIKQKKKSPPESELYTGEFSGALMERNAAIIKALFEYKGAKATSGLSAASLDLNALKNSLGLNFIFTRIIKKELPDGVNSPFLLHMRGKSGDGWTVGTKKAGVLRINGANGPEKAALEEILGSWDGKTVFIADRINAARAGAGSAGMAAASVEGLQAKLNRLGYILKTDGLYGGETERIIRIFQDDYGLKADGVARQDTLLLLSVLAGK